MGAPRWRIAGLEPQEGRVLDRRFEIFVSSTRHDLETQREYVRESVVAAGHIPSGMERFPDGHEPQWDAITRAIDRCDAYVLIVGARYGSSDGDGLAYTHREYHYALALGKPVLVFCLTPDGASQWPLRDDPESADEVERTRAARLEDFRREVMSRLVYLWKSEQEFHHLVDRHLAPWIARVCNRGWVRWDAFSLAASQRDVYTFLFNHLTPFRRISLSEPFLERLDEPLETMDAALLMMTVLLKDFVAPRVPPHVRVYFAYRLARPRPVGDAVGGDHACYAFGTTVQRRDLQRERGEIAEDAWMPGFLVGKESNVDRAYESAQIRSVIDATRASRGAEDANQLVQGEGSVLSVPIVFSTAPREAQHTIGVLGLSSPEPGEVSSDPFHRLGQEFQTTLSSLFYAHAVRRSTGTKVSSRVMAGRLRREIARHFEDTLPPLPRDAATSDARSGRRRTPAQTDSVAR